MSTNPIDVLEELRGYQEVRTCPEVPAAVRAFAKVMGHDKDHVERIDVYSTTCHIEFSWLVLCCDQSKSYEVPLAVLQAADVEKATLVWKLTREKQDAERRLAEHRSSARWVEKHIAELDASLAEAKAQQAAAGATP